MVGLLGHRYTEIFCSHIVLTDGTYPVLSTLAVSPTHQRLGLASLLLKEGLAVPDRANARTYIQASPVAVPLYLKHGWRQVDDILFDMRPHGGKGISSDKVLFREPGGK